MLLVSIVLCLILTAEVNASCSGYKDRFTDDQWHVIETSYHDGVDEGLGWSLAAISIAESSAGIELIRWSDGSYGVYHILMTTAIKRYSKDNVDFNPKSAYDTFSLAFKLAFNQGFSAKFAIRELNYWRLQYGDDWEKVWASYNAGWKYKNGIDYSRKISYHIKQLKTCTKQEFYHDTPTNIS